MGYYEGDLSTGLKSARAWMWALSGCSQGLREPLREQTRISLLGDR